MTSAGNPEHTHRPEGEHMHHEAHHDIEITYFDNDAVRGEYLRDLYAQTHASGEYDPRHPEVFRTPGAFILEFATGELGSDHPVREEQSRYFCMLHG